MAVAISHLMSKGVIFKLLKDLISPFSLLLRVQNVKIAYRKSWSDKVGDNYCGSSLVVV